MKARLLEILVIIEFLVLVAISVELFALYKHTKLANRMNEHVHDTSDRLIRSDELVRLLDEHLMKINEQMTRFDEHMSRVNEYMIKLDEHLIRFDEHVNRLDNFILKYYVQRKDEVES